MTNLHYKPSLLALLLVSAAASGCGDSNTSPVDLGTADTGSLDNGTTDQGVGTARGRENPPTLGAQIDRIGRPAISTASVGTFLPNGAPRDNLKDSYNANANPSTWAAMYAAGIADMIAVYDGADTMCGNQLGYDAAGGVASAYNFLAGVLADDRLVIDSSTGTCTEYLGYEAEVLDVLGGADGGCGGRTPNYDVIDRSYSVLINGSLGAFGDEIDADSVTHNITAFPFLAAP